MCQSCQLQVCCPPSYPTRIPPPCPIPCNPCRKVSKAKKGEPPCGCVYGCPCKAACYDWNPCMRTLN